MSHNNALQRVNSSVARNNRRMERNLDPGEDVLRDDEDDYTYRDSMSKWSWLLAILSDHFWISFFFFVFVFWTTYDFMSHMAEEWVSPVNHNFWEDSFKYSNSDLCMKDPGLSMCVQSLQWTQNWWCTTMAWLAVQKYTQHWTTVLGWISAAYTWCEAGTFCRHNITNLATTVSGNLIFLIVIAAYCLTMFASINHNKFKFHSLQEKNKQLMLIMQQQVRVKKVTRVPKSKGQRVPPSVQPLSSSVPPFAKETHERAEGETNLPPVHDISEFMLPKISVRPDFNSIPHASSSSSSCSSKDTSHHYVHPHYNNSVTPHYGTTYSFHTA